MSPGWRGRQQDQALGLGGMPMAKQTDASGHLRGWMDSPLDLVPSCVGHAGLWVVSQRLAGLPAVDEAHSRDRVLVPVGDCQPCPPDVPSVQWFFYKLPQGCCLWCRWPRRQDTSCHVPRRGGARCVQSEAGPTSSGPRPSF